MNAVYVIILGFLIAYIGYRFYAKYVDAKIIQADAKRATPAKMYMDGVEFMPTSKNVLYGYQFKSIAGAAPIIGPILALQWGWLPALIWVLAGTLFIGWVHDYSSMMISVRHEGQSFGALSHRLISPRARVILLSFIYFYLLLIVGAFGNIVVNTAANLKSAPMAWLFLTIAGVLAGQMIYRWKRDIILTTVVTVLIALLGRGCGNSGSFRQHSGRCCVRQQVDLGDSRFRVLLLCISLADLEICTAYQLRSSVYRLHRPLLRYNRGVRGPSEYGSACVHSGTGSPSDHCGQCCSSP